MAIYQQQFGLSQSPFSLTPDTDLFLNTQTHRDALNTLLTSLRYSEGFIKVVGEVGTGKTLLCRKLLSLLDDSYITCYVTNPYLSPDELKVYLATEIGADVTPDMPMQQIFMATNQRLLELAGESKQVVLVIDEAQAMPVDTIEALRLLTNLETEKRKLLQVILFGQPELDELLAQKGLRQLKQRIVFSEYLHPFNRRGTEVYIHHRLAAVGGSEAQFTRVACWMIDAASKGVPRLINVMAHKAMLAAYGKGAHKVTSKEAAKAIFDTSEANLIGKLLALRWHWLWPALCGASAWLLLSQMGGSI